ncbi:hypothetical protein JTB14_029817 [Gonioctena quinquepunctata]|nr:hypothetical protein JTB14_029817 [Gonioctena quinquepunctata]
MYLVASKMFDSIEHKFLVVGHSFSAADRNFAIIEKRWKLVRAETLGDVQKCRVSARHERPFKVLQIGGTFLDFDKAAESVINTKKLDIECVPDPHHHEQLV